MINHSQPPPAPTLAHRIIDLPAGCKRDFANLVASHFATADTLARATVERFVDEALAVGKP